MLEIETDAEGKPLPAALSIAGVNVSEFSVVIPADMPAGLVTVVDKLIAQLKTATGHTIPKLTADRSAEHEIVVGRGVRENAAVDAAVAEIKNDGYAIVVDGGDLYISASTNRGVAYGVYDFLENYMGTRFYDPFYTVQRSVGAVTLADGMKDVFSPPRAARMFSSAFNSTTDYYVYGKLNGLTHITNVGEDSTSILAGAAHNLATLSGKGSNVRGNNACLQDDEVFAAVLKNLLADLEANPDKYNISVGQGDSSVFCSCDKCAEFKKAHGNTNMANMLDFCNRLAVEVNKVYPDVKLITFSYQDTRKAPTDMTVNKNVQINYCLDGACFQHALNDPDCKKNAKIAAELKAWKKLCENGNIYIYDYIPDCTYAVPGTNPYIMWNNAQFYNEMGVGGIYNWGTYGTHGFSYLRYYLANKLSWNPNMTEDEYYTIFNEFLEDYYGDAAPYMKEHLDLFYAPENIIDCSQMFSDWRNFVSIKFVKGKKDLTPMHDAFKHFTDALALETLSEEERAHVEYTSLNLLATLVSEIPNSSEPKRINEYRTLYREFTKKHGTPKGM